MDSLQRIRDSVIQRRQHEWWPALGLVYLTGIMMVLGIRAMHMHPDEQLAYFFTRRDLPFLWWYLGTQDTHPPLWFSSFYLMRHLFGETEFVARFYSALLSFVTVSLVYQLGRRWFGAARYGWYVMAALGVNAFFLYHALEMRPYALIMLLATASMWTFQRWLTRRTPRAAVSYGVTVAAMLYVHYFLFVLILIQWVYLLAAWWVVPAGAKPASTVRASLLVLIRQGILAGGVALLLWLPWLPSALNQVANLRRVELLGGNQRGVVGAGTTTVTTSLAAVTDLAHTATNSLTPLYLVILLAGMILLWRRANFWLALAWAVGAPTLSFVLNTVAAIYTPRYVLYMVVGLAVTVGASLAALPIGRWRWLLVSFVALNLLVVPGQFPDRTPYRNLFLRISAAAQPGDVIFFDQADADSRFLQWQVRQYLVRDLRQNRVTTADEALEYPRVWYVTNDWFNPQVRANFERIEASHPLQQVYGDCTSAWCYLAQLLAVPAESDP